jgi:hypothetical protein
MSVKRADGERSCPQKHLGPLPCADGRAAGTGEKRAEPPAAAIDLEIESL